ncbi:MAG: 50S ribosomal protein L33 [Armatimonadota bacterium]
MASEKYALQCSKCKALNYVKTKNRKPNAPKLVVKKFCRPCGGHTEHSETRLRR